MRVRLVALSGPSPSHPHWFSPVPSPICLAAKSEAAAHTPLPPSLPRVPVSLACLLCLLAMSCHVVMVARLCPNKYPQPWDPRSHLCPLSHLPHSHSLALCP